jgi:hypothetical protein
MDLLEVTTQGIGLALAAGMFAGALAGAVGPAAGERGPGLGAVSGVLLVLAAIGGAIMFGASLRVEDHPAWPGWPVGALLTAFAFVVVRGVVVGASSRAGQGGSPGAVAGIAMVAALVVAAASLLFGPLGLLALAGLVYLSVRRRRRATEKYEGLRSLR